MLVPNLRSRVQSKEQAEGVDPEYASSPIVCKDFAMDLRNIY